MSFKQNDTNDNNMIHLGNYEEFFILYMDNELSDEQMKMVDEFMVQHPDLQGEFELLMSTRLPMEDLNMNKTELMADRMRLTTVDEELLLYVDNELTSQEKKVVELELKSNKDYQLQHELLMKAKLPASEKIVYPNKKELYRKEETRVVLLRPWMRVAAAVVVIAMAGVLYFTNSNSPVSTQDSNLTANKDNKDTKNIAQDNRQQMTSETGNAIAATKEQAKQQESRVKKQNAPATTDQPQFPKEVIANIAKVDKQNQQIIQKTENPEVVLRDKTANIEKKSFSDVAAAEIKTPSEIINKNEVTTAIANRNTIEEVTPKENNTAVASNKGSVKGFLRKATRVIEKRTGIDPTNDGELLIGAVAINLK